jgi:uncharacterized membrane protein
MTAPLLSQLRQAKNGLEDAQIAYCGVVTAHAEARRVLERAEAIKLCEGVEGKNEKERAAKLKLELTTEYTALAEAEDALTEARCGLEVARLEWTLAQLQLRDLGSEIAA